MSSRDLIMNHRTVEAVEACGGTVYLRPMNGPETVALHQWQSNNEDRTGMDVMAQVLVRCLCDEDGNREWGDEEAGLLAETLAAVDLRHLYEVAERMNGLTEAEVEAAEGN